MRMNWLALAGILCVSCPVVAESNLALSEKVRAELSRLVFKYNPLPPQVGADELRAYQDRTLQSPLAQFQQAELSRLYGDDVRLKVMLHRDTDGDGIRDFSVSDYFGRIYANDTDIDGDGIINVLDASPYNPSEPTTGEFVEANAGLESVPRHISFCEPRHRIDFRFNLRKCHLQTLIYNRFGIAVVELGAHFTVENLEVLYDAIQLYTGSGADRFLKVIYADQDALITPSPGDIEAYEAVWGMYDDVQGVTAAQVLDKSEAMVLYAKHLKASKVEQLGTLMHELAHAVQFSYGLKGEVNMFQLGQSVLPGFYRLMESFGWEITFPQARLSESEYPLFVPTYGGELNKEYETAAFDGKSIDEWRAIIEQKREADGAGYLRDADIQSRSIVGYYALLSPFEWHAEMLTSLFFIRVEQAVRVKYPAQADRLIDELVSKQASSWGYRYQNAANLQGKERLESTLNMPADDLSRLVDKYFPVSQRVLTQSTVE